MEEKSTNKVAGSGSERERLHERFGREWATSVSKRVDAKTVDSSGLFGRGCFDCLFIAGAPFSVCLFSYRLLGDSLLL